MGTRNWNSMYDEEDQRLAARKNHICRIDTSLLCTGWEDEYLVISIIECCGSDDYRVNFCPMCGLPSANKITEK